jgi:hypothetical protein
MTLRKVVFNIDGNKPIEYNESDINHLIYLDGEIVLAPTVTTNIVSNITGITATCGGIVTSDGGVYVTERGVCWKTKAAPEDPAPTTGDTHTHDGEDIGLFSSSLTGLTVSTTYYVRAYAINSEGTSYGVERSFITM